MLKKTTGFFGTTYVEKERIEVAHLKMGGIKD